MLLGLRLGKYVIQQHYDICIIGGGMTGAALALGLAQLNVTAQANQKKYKIALIEERPISEYSPAQAPDLRLSAINMHTVELFKKLGAWQPLCNTRIRMYDRLSVWDADNPFAGIRSNKQGAFTQFTANEVKRNELGYFAENKLIQLSLYTAMAEQQLSNVDQIFEHTITQIDTRKGVLVLRDKNDHLIEVQAPVIFGADGANSLVRRAAKIATSGWQYSQHANAILIKTAERVANETWQAFYASGPRALLPMHDNFACLVWYDTVQQTQWIQSSKPEDLKKAIKNHFPRLQTDFDVVQVAHFGLTRMHAKQYGRDKAIILGDAAHTINPLAGQGVNLGFKDVAALLTIIEQNGVDDLAALVNEYEAKRKIPNLVMMTAMDLLYKGFSSSDMGIKSLRCIGLSLANNAGPIKQQALKYAMGI